VVENLPRKPGKGEALSSKFKPQYRRWGGGREARLGKKVSETLSQRTSRAGWYMPVIPATQEVQLEGFTVKTGPGIKCKTLSEK
jgi:hypothetical protein